MTWLTIAIAKGRLQKEMLKQLHKIGMATKINADSRKLIFTDEVARIKYIFVKPVDVVTYVERGVADIGVTGKDIILEQDLDVYELLDLQFGKCFFAIAGFPGASTYDVERTIRVGTKYPNITAKYFQGKQKVELLYLNGSVELAPIMDMADVVVDLVETGNTLKANGLVVLEKMFDIQAKVIANRTSYAFEAERINQLLNQLGQEENDDVTNYSWE